MGLSWQQPDDEPYPYHLRDPKQRVRSMQIILLSALLAILLIIIASWLHDHHGCISGVRHWRNIEIDTTGYKPAHHAGWVCEAP